eukprot:187654_1
MTNEDAFIVGVSQFNVKRFRDNASSSQTILNASSQLLDNALNDASDTLERECIDGLFSFKPNYFVDNSVKYAPPKYLYPSWLASKLGLYKPENKPFITKICECGGSSVISMCLAAKHAIQNNNANCIAIIMISIPNSANRNDYIDNGMQRYAANMKELNLKIDSKTPPIASLYGAHTKSFLDKYGNKYGIKRKHLAMIPCLMYRNGYNHPEALCYKDNKLLNANIDKIMNSNKVTDFDCLKQYECARLCDGGICIIVASKSFILQQNINMNRCFKIRAGAEYVNNYFNKQYIEGDYKNYSMFHSVRKCLNNGNINDINDIDW